MTPSPQTKAFFSCSEKDCRESELASSFPHHLVVEICPELVKTIPPLFKFVVANIFKIVGEYPREANGDVLLVLESVFLYITIMRNLHLIKMLHSKRKQSQFAGRIRKAEITWISASSVDTKNGTSTLLASTTVSPSLRTEAHTQVYRNISMR